MLRLTMFLLAFAATAHAAPPSPADRAREFAEAVMKPVVLRIPGMDRVRVRADVSYRNDAGPQAKADFYLPPRAQSRVPVVVFIHGGVGADVPVRPKDWGVYRSWGRLVAASGMAAVTFNHRLGFPDPRMNDAASDLAALLRFVREHASEYGIDGERIALAAYSAGGPLLSPYIAEPSPGIRCLVGFYPILGMSEGDPRRPFMDARQQEEFSDVVQVRKHGQSMPPMFLTRAGKDRVPGLNAAMQDFVAAALEVNAPLTLMVHPTGAHGFDNQNDDERSREIVRAALSFLSTHLAAGTMVSE